MFYLTTHSTHFSYEHMVKDNSDSKRGNTLPPHVLLFPLSNKGSFICTFPQIGERERAVAYPYMHACTYTRALQICVIFR